MEIILRMWSFFGFLAFVGASATVSRVTRLEAEVKELRGALGLPPPEAGSATVAANAPKLWIIITIMALLGAAAGGFGLMLFLGE